MSNGHNQQGPGCPPAEVWDQVASGLLRGERAEDLLAHASVCAACAALLQDAIAIFAPEEAVNTETVDRKPSSVAVIPSRRRSWAIAVAAAAALLIAFGGFYAYWRANQGTAALSELARIYADNRNLELRLPGASYGTMRSQRGAAERVPALLTEAAKILQGVNQHPKDTAWLHARGRLALLDWKPLDAVAALEEAADLAPPSVDLLVDLATAYYERGMQANQPQDLHKALDLLGQALQREPKHAAARYNRALVEEQLHETGPAIDDLEKLLQIEPRGGWAEETRTALERLRRTHARLYQRDRRQLAQDFVELALDQDVVSGGAGEAELAARLAKDHGDEWLADVGRLPAANAGPIALLRRMADIRLTLESGRYEGEKAAFAALAVTPQPDPIGAWADFESVHRATHVRSTYPCPTDPEPLLARMERRHYRWLRAQTLRELGICEFQKGNLAGAVAFVTRGIEAAREAGYPLSEIRASSILAHADLRRGRVRQAARAASDALARCERDGFPPGRAQEFFNIMMQAAQSGGLWHAARVSAASMAGAEDAAQFRDLKFTNRAVWAQMALRCGETREAAELYGQALEIQKGLAPTSARAWIEIGFADATNDESRLAQVEQVLEKSTDASEWIPYQRVRARIAMEQGRFADAEERLRKIVAFMEAPQTGKTPPSHRWRTEFQQATAVHLELLSRRGQLAESFDRLEQWRAMEDRTRTRIGVVAAAAGGTAERRVVFAVARVGARLAVWKSLIGARTAPDFRWADGTVETNERLARRLARLVANPESSVAAITAAGKELQESLFGRWLEALAPHEQVLVQVDGPLGNVAFAALPGFGGHPVGVTSFAIPAGATATARTEAPAGSRFLLLLDGTRVAPSWMPELALTPLPNAGREVRAIEALSWFAVETVDGAVVSREELRNALGRASMVHFAGHSAASSTGVVLALTRDGSFDPETVSAPMPASVVLSACSTGRRVRGGETETGSPDSLASAFLEKGSREVIASLWDVDSAATELFMKSYYAHLRELSDSGTALEAAREDMRRTGNLAHPYYWAAFERFVRL